MATSCRSASEAVMRRLTPARSTPGSPRLATCAWPRRFPIGWRPISSPLLVVTDGPSGSLARFTTPQGEPVTIRVPAFPRNRPPRDTNRAGEAFAATFISTLLSQGWQPASGVVAADLVRQAMIRAAAAAALVLDRTDFGFPAPEAIDIALR